MNIIRSLLGERPGMSAGQGYEISALRDQAILAPSITIDMQVRIPDVSYYQDKINFALMASRGVGGVIIRAGQRNWIDSKFNENWAAAKAAGLPRGSYWYYDSRETPQKQAALWVSALNGDLGELCLVADLEESYGGAYGSKAHFKTFLQEVERLTGLEPGTRIVIYTGFYWWGQRVGNDPFFKAYRLWLAWYNVPSAVKVPLPWEESDLILWQYTSSGDGHYYGVSSLEIDLNWFCCSWEEFRELFQLENGGGTVTVQIWVTTTQKTYYRLTIDGENVGTIPAATDLLVAYEPPGSNFTQVWFNGAKVYVNEQSLTNRREMPVGSSSPSSSRSASPSPSSSNSPSASPSAAPGEIQVVTDVTVSEDGVVQKVVVNGQEYIKK